MVEKIEALRMDWTKLELSGDDNNHAEDGQVLADVNEDPQLLRVAATVAVSSFTIDSLSD